MKISLEAQNYIQQTQTYLEIIYYRFIFYNLTKWSDEMVD